MDTIKLLSIVFGIISLGFLNALLMIAEVSLVKIRYLTIDEKKLKQLRANKILSRILDNAGSIAWVIRYGLIASLLLVGILIYGMASLVVGMLDFASEGTSIVVVLAFFIFGIHAIMANLILRGVGSADPEENLITYSGIINIACKIFIPFIWLFRYLGHLFLKITASKAQDDFDAFDTNLHIRALGHLNVSLSSRIQRIIRNAIRLPQLDVSDVLLPRHQVQFFDTNLSVEENIEKAKSTGHTRFPVCDGSLDSCQGIIHIKDLFQYQGQLETLDINKFQHQVLRFSENTPLEEAFSKILRCKIHMALVVDQFGGAIGVITLEDILEELVGTIQDEFDMEDAMIIPLVDNVYKVFGLASIGEVESNLGVTIDNQDVSTFGGLITAELGRIPEKNERLKIGDLSIKIDEVSDKRVISSTVRVRSDSRESED